MAMTNDEQLACKMKALRTHGIERKTRILRIPQKAVAVRTTGSSTTTE